MRNHKRKPVLLFISLVVVVVTAMATLRGQTEIGKPHKDQRTRTSNDSQFPSVDYDSQESVASEQEEVRRARGNLYKGNGIKEDPRVKIITDTDSLIERLPSLPIPQSDVIVLGEVTKAQAFLSTDKTGVYSEFNVHIDEVLKDKTGGNLSPSAEIVINRSGGRVRFPSGHIQVYTSSGQGMPIANGRYLLFLKHNNAQSFFLLTGYEFRSGLVLPVDNVSSQDIYKSFDETVFLNEIRTSIAGYSNAPSEKGGQKQ
ncbi:MAG: hypothetical protein ABR577_02310 [Pyrinomonadaceae bacterium]